MAEYRVRLNTAGVGDLLKGPEMKDCLERVARDIQARCGIGYETDTKLMPTRQIASVYTATADAMKDNADNNVLLRALS